MHGDPATAHGSAVLKALDEIEAAVIVAVVAMLVMQVAGYDVVDVVSVRNCLVAAVGAVAVSLLVRAAGMLGRAIARIPVRHADPMFIDVVTLNVMQMTVVQIIGMAIVPDGRVAASWAVLV